MKLIIDIDEKVREHILDLADSMDIPLGVTSHMVKAIANGIPLDDIRAEIQSYADMLKMCNASPSIEYILQIIDKHMEGDMDGNRQGH